MSSRHDAEFDKLIKAYTQARPVLMQRAATMAVTFFKENFRRQGFLDRTLEPWDKRVDGSPSKKPLEINRGFLRRAVMKKSVRATRAVVGVDPGIKYAEIQNNGGQIPITNKMRRFFWAMYYKNKGGVTSSIKTKQENQTQRNKTLNEAADFWKNLALTKKTHIDIKARPFIDDSFTLQQQIFEMFDTEIYKIIKP